MSYVNTSMTFAAPEPTYKSGSKVPRKQRAIVSTAVHLFKRYGIKRVSVEEICREAGASKPTFYKYFPNKVELVKHILNLMSQAARRKIDEIKSMADVPFHEKVRLLIDDWLEHTRRMSDAFIEDLRHFDRELAAYFRNQVAENQRRFLDFIAAGQAQGEVRPEVRLDFVLAVLGKLNDLAADEQLRALYPDYVAMTREIVDFFFYGLLTHPRP